MNPEKAITWIRDGTLINRMPENATAFAIATYQHLSSNRADITLEDLINWCFKNSGISAMKKMELFNSVHNNAISDVKSANAYYTTLAEAIGSFVNYFEGAPELIRELIERGVRTYITSAVKQDIMDVWKENEQGSQIDSNVEILGDGTKGKKGEEHFKYIREQGGPVQIYSVADATSEIEDAKKFANTPIGFAYVITRERINEAFAKVMSTGETLGYDFLKIPTNINLEKIILPDNAELVRALQNAGAKITITGDEASLIKNLKAYLKQEGLL